MQCKTTVDIYGEMKDVNNLLKELRDDVYRKCCIQRRAIKSSSVILVDSKNPFQWFELLRNNGVRWTDIKCASFE